MARAIDEGSGPMAMGPVKQDVLTELQLENAHLIALLESHGMPWCRPPATPILPPQPILLSGPTKFTTSEEVALFRRLFRGRTDVYPVRWESMTTGKSGYSPKCGNEWVTHVCGKMQGMKCADCGNRLFLTLSDLVIHDHLPGEHTVGVYPLLADDTCHFLAVDFDEAEWQQDALAFIQSCRELGVAAALEVSRSGKGAHAWKFFAALCGS